MRSVVADLVRLHDVAMVEPRRETRFLQEHREEGLVLRELRLQLLDDDELVEARRTPRNRKVDDAHSAAGNLCDELVPSDSQGGPRDPSPDPGNPRE